MIRTQSCGNFFYYRSSSLSLPLSHTVNSKHLSPFRPFLCSTFECTPSRFSSLQLLFLLISSNSLSSHATTLHGHFVSLQVQADSNTEIDQLLIEKEELYLRLKSTYMTKLIFFQNERSPNQMYDVDKCQRSLIFGKRVCLYSHRCRFTLVTIFSSIVATFPPVGNIILILNS